ncbi:MAG: hypothetical protein JO322_01800 [Candidatus Eremiobacteraeota bacterium]|nr:hypothetical protein [Candidatus Eremiobacteraeota bacterium]
MNHASYKDSKFGAFRRPVVGLCAIVLTAALAACGGGGGGSITPNGSAAQGAAAAPGQPGAAAPLTGAASAGPSASPSASPTPNTSVPAHIQTWAFDEYWAEGANAPSSAVAQYLTYAEGGAGNGKAQSDCSGSPKTCSSVFYVDPNFKYASPTCPMAESAAFIAAAGSDESWFVHEAGYTDFAHRVQGSYAQSCQGATVTIPVYLANDASPNVAAYYQNYLQSNGDKWDYYFMDDTSTLVLSQTYGPGGGFCQDSLPNHWCSSTQEYPNDSAVAQAHLTFASSLSHTNGQPMQFFFNGVSFSGQTPLNLQLLSMGSGHFMGAVCENCIVNAGTPRPNMFAPVLNAMAQIDAIPGAAFIELNTGSSPTASTAQLAARYLTTAMAWLGYSEGHTIVFPNLEDNTNNLAVWPEDLLYPTQPLQSMTSGATDLQVAPGVYRREFASCYNNQSPIGPCAAIVNSTSSPVPIAAAWLQQTYHHILQMSGGDILSGGTTVLNTAYFTPGVGSLGAGAATILVK